MDDAHRALNLLREQRHDRTTFARTIEERLRQTAFYTTSTAQLAPTIRQVLHEDEQYEALTGEPMPAHHHEVLRAELAHWMAYDDLLRAPPTSEEAYPAFCRDLQPRAAQLVQTLHLAQEILDSPLVAHHRAALTRIADETAEADVTRNPTRALAQLAEDRQGRRLVAQRTYQHVVRGTFFDASTTDLTYGWHHTTEDQRFYEDATGEPMPDHAIRANHLELRLWGHLAQTHAHPTTRRDAACRRLRPIARILQRAIEIEDDLLTTPLVRYYERIIDQLEQAARRADRSFILRLTP
jgi:hypothetical protein